MVMKIISVFLALSSLSKSTTTLAFGVADRLHGGRHPSLLSTRVETPSYRPQPRPNYGFHPQKERFLASSPSNNDSGTQGNKQEENDKAVGNLVADDEWDCLGLELSELVKKAVMEDLKKNAREFLGKDDYKVGDICKEIDSRVKTEVAQIRNKEEYELGDLVLAMDAVSKEMTQDLTGKPYEAGDLSREIDNRIKSKLAEICGKETYEVGDLTREMDKRVQNRVREIELGRQEWVKNFLGESAAEEYKVGDITKKAVSNFTGKENYEFGDITRKLAGNLFGGKKDKTKDE
jgi:hypothetical protein